MYYYRVTDAPNCCRRAWTVLDNALPPREACRTMARFERDVRSVLVKMREALARRMLTDDDLAEE